MARQKKPKDTCAQFEGEDFKYRPDEFLTYGHDDKGQSVRLFFRAAPTLERQLEIILGGKRFPYATISDILRHAVYRHVEWLQRMEPDMPRHFLSTLYAINEVVRDAEMIAQTQQTFSKLDALVEHLLATGDRVEAQRVLSVAKGQLSKIPDSRWKKLFTESFSSKYARHFGSVVPTPAPKAPLLEFPAVATQNSPPDSEAPGGEGGDGEGEPAENLDSKTEWEGLD